jgi:hypothetical protein
MIPICNTKFQGIRSRTKFGQDGLTWLNGEGNFNYTFEDGIAKYIIIGNDEQRDRYPCRVMQIANKSMQVGADSSHLVSRRGGPALTVTTVITDNDLIVLEVKACPPSCFRFNTYKLNSVHGP